MSVFAVLFDLYSFAYYILKDLSTSLMRAASEGHADVVQLLLSAGANKEAADDVKLIINC